MDRDGYGPVLLAYLLSLLLLLLLLFVPNNQCPNHLANIEVHTHRPHDLRFSCWQEVCTAAQLFLLRYSIPCP